MGISGPIIENRLEKNMECQLDSKYDSSLTAKVGT